MMIELGSLNILSQRKANCSFNYHNNHLVSSAEIGQSGFFMVLQDQKLLQNQKQDLLPVSEAPVQAGAPV